MNKIKSNGYLRVSVLVELSHRVNHITRDPFPDEVHSLRECDGVV